MPRSPRVVIIEDHESTRSRIAGIFAKRGWDACAAATVSEGLARLSPAPDCVILDLNLPDGPGEAVLRAIRDDQLPVGVVAVVTATTDSIRLRHLAAYRPNLTIMKPFDWHVLVRYCEAEVGHAPQ